MKINFDKVTKEPSHSLSKKELKTIFDNIPGEWIDGFDSFLISSFGDSAFIRPA